MQKWAMGVARSKRDGDICRAAEVRRGVNEPSRNAKKKRKRDNAD
jgi:hypothetical protein